MKLPPDDRYFPTESSIEDYDKEMAQADSNLDVATFVQLARGKSAIYCNLETIEVSQSMYSALDEAAKGDLTGIGHSLCLNEDKVHINRIPIVCKPEPSCPSI